MWRIFLLWGSKKKEIKFSKFLPSAAHLPPRRPPRALRLPAPPAGEGSAACSARVGLRKGGGKVDAAHTRRFEPPLKRFQLNGCLFFFSPLPPRRNPPRAEQHPARCFFLYYFWVAHSRVVFLSSFGRQRVAPLSLCRHV